MRQRLSLSRAIDLFENDKGFDEMNNFAKGHDQIQYLYLFGNYYRFSLSKFLLPFELNN